MVTDPRERDKKCTADLKVKATLPPTNATAIAPLAAGITTAGTVFERAINRACGSRQEHEESGGGGT